MNRADRITQAKTKLILHQPFFASIVTRLEIVEVPEGETTLGGQKVDTMATDMKRIYYNAKFVDRLTTEECAGVLMHEVLHVAWLHGLRRGHRDPLLWNIACDFAINPVVLESGGVLPIMEGGDKDNPGYCYDKKYENMSAFAIYDDLLKDDHPQKFKLSSQGKGGGDGEVDQDGKQPLWGEVLEPTDDQGKPLSESDRVELEEETKINVKSAAEAAKAVGKLPGSLKSLIEAAGKPKVNWVEYIQRWLSGLTPDDYTWRRSNRRMMANWGIYMPTIQFNGAGVGVLSIDTSGSVSDEELRSYITEIVGVIELCKPDKLYIIQHDAKVHSITDWEAGEDFSSLKITGRGGTNITPTFKAMEELEEAANWMIIFSDMEIWDWPDEAPEIPCLMCTTGSENVPYGTLIPLKDAM